MARRNSVVKALDLGFYGPEPIYDRVITGRELTDALTWYNYNIDHKDAISFLVEYLNEQGDKDTAAIVKAGGKEVFAFTLGKLARLINNGATLPDYAYDWIKTGLRDGIAKFNRSKLEVVYSAPGKLNETNAALVDAILRVIEDRKTDADVISLLEEAKVSVRTAQQIIDYVNAEAQKEASFFTLEEAEEKAKYLRLVAEVIGEINVYISGGEEVPKAQVPIKSGRVSAEQFAPPTEVVVKKTRKPRAKKIIPVEKKVAKVQYLKEFPELGLKSISPKEIVGKTALWYYDVAYKKLVVVRKADGLDVKGTTVIFDEKISESKKIGRKTKEILDQVLKGNKVGLKKIFTTINTGFVEVTGRLSENTILLKTEK